MSDPGSVRYSTGDGLLTVANDTMVFVAPNGPDAERWSDLALAPATESEWEAALAAQVPEDLHIAAVQLRDGGSALMIEPGRPRLATVVERAPNTRIRFGMAPSATAGLWVAAGVVAASGVEVVGFALAETATTEPEEQAGSAGMWPLDRPVEQSAMPGPPSDAMPVENLPPEAMPVEAGPSEALPVDAAPSPPVPTPAERHSIVESSPDATVVEAVPPPPTGDPVAPARSPLGRPDEPVLPTSLFPDVPIEEPFAATPAPPAGNPVIERAPTPPPPGIPRIESSPPPPAAAPPPAIQTVELLFDDGQRVPLTSTLAVGRAPEGSDHAPNDATIVVVSGDQVSRCHFVIRPTDLGAEVIDTNSLNGCFVDYPNRPGSGPQIPVGVPVPMEVGQHLRFGDRSLRLVDQGSA